MKCDIKDCKGEAKYKTKNGWCVCATHKIQILDETELIKDEPTKDDIEYEERIKTAREIAKQDLINRTQNISETELIAEFFKDKTKIYRQISEENPNMNDLIINRLATGQAARNLIIDVQYDMSRVNAKVVNKGYLEGIKVGKQKTASAIIKIVESGISSEDIIKEIKKKHLPKAKEAK